MQLAAASMPLLSASTWDMSCYMRSCPSPTPQAYLSSHVLRRCFRNLQRHSEVLLECLPGLWQAAGTSKLQLPLNLPASAAAKLQQTLAGAAGILQRLVSSYCKEVDALAAALAGVGPLREALLAAAEVRCAILLPLRCCCVVRCGTWLCASTFVHCGWLLVCTSCV